MDGDSYIVDENEPTFDVGEWMSELEADDQVGFSFGNTGVEEAGVSFPYANANGNNKKADEKFCPKRESTSDFFLDMCQTPTPTASDSGNFSGMARKGRFSATSSTVRQKVQDSVLRHSPNQLNLYHQSQPEPLDQLQNPQQYMSTRMQQTSERLKILNPSTLPLRPEASRANNVIGSSTRPLDMSENFQKRLVQTCGGQQPRIGSDSDVPIKPDTMISHQNLQQVQRPGQFYHHLGAQNLRNDLSRGMKRKMPENFHSQGLIFGGQLNPNQFSQRMAHDGSSASINMAQNRVLYSDFSEWHDEAYSQLLTMKRLYLNEVMRVYQRYQELSTIQPSNVEFAITFERTRIYIGRIINFLNMPKRDIIHCSKEKIYSYMNQVTNFIYQTRAKLSFPSQYHHPIAQPQKQFQNRNLQFNRPNGGSVSAAVCPNRFVTGPGANVKAGSSYVSQQSPLPAMPELANILSQGWVDQRAPDLLQPCSTAPLDSPVFQSQNLRNCEDPQFMQANKLQRPHQPLIDQHKQQKFVSRMSESNDLTFGESMCSSSTKSQQPCQDAISQDAISQDINYFSQTVLSCNSGQTYVAPLQSGQCSSPQVDSNDCSSKVSKGSLTLQSIGSPFVVPSPLTPLTPSSSIVDHVKKSSNHSPSLFSGEDSRELVLLSKTEPQAPERNYAAPDVIEVEKSHLPPQVEPEEVQEPNAENGPFKRFLEVVKSSSQKALNSALQDIGAVTNLIDRKEGAALVNGSRYIINHDLADEVQYSWKDNNLLNLEYEVLPSSSWSCASESFSHLSGECLNLESIASSQSKRQKTEENYLLMEEVKEVNKRLVETVAEIVMDKTGFTAYEADEEITIRCSYLPVGRFATSHVGFPGLLLRLLVNKDYPHSSPIVLDVNPYNCSETEEVQAITEKAKSQFNLSLRKFSEPLSLSVMVKAWDIAAREVYHECAKKFGGQSFSSRYGGWEGCVTAA